MARNKREAVKDKDKLKKIRKEARKRWRQKKAAKKAMKKLPAEKKLNEDKERRKLREIDPSLVVRTTKFLGAGTFGSCYLAYYRDVVVAVKELNERKNVDLRSEVCHEATMIKHLEDHRGVPLLFGIVTKSEPYRLVTKYHGVQNKGLTLCKAIKKEKLEKPTWLGILKNLIEALNHVHSCAILHNDVKSNNVVMEQRGEEWNPVVIDFGKARFSSDPKPAMSMSINQQMRYREKYAHIAPEIVNGSGRQSAQSDIFSLGKIVLAVLDLLPTATAKSLKVARTALCEEPAERPSLKELSEAL